MCLLWHSVRASENMFGNLLKRLPNMFLCIRRQAKLELNSDRYNFFKFFVRDSLPLSVLKIEYIISSQYQDLRCL